MRASPRLLATALSTAIAGACCAVLAGPVATGQATADTRADPSSASPWATAAKIDIDAIHDHLLANHPAMVDDTPLGHRYRRWLEEGREIVLREAAAATTSADYARALRRYINGFEDGHLGVSFDGLGKSQWPGFFGRESEPGRISVVAVGDDAPVPTGATLESCDGRDASRLMDELVLPYRVNAAIPHQRFEVSPRLFLSFADDQRRPTRCRFVVDGATREVDLAWRTTDDAAVKLLFEAAGSAGAPLGMRSVDGVTFISAQSFSLFDKEAGTMRKLLARIEKDRARLRREPYLVIDVRGNGGGNSDWGAQLAAALYGRDWVTAASRSFDWSVDWRATAHNAQVMRNNAKSQRENGMNDVAEGSDRIAGRIEAAVAAGEPYYRSEYAVEPFETPATSPFTGKVYFLTDHACASACLDFADILLRMPGVIHVGLPTSADAVYIDNYGFPLPSGKAQLGTSLKVYRHRVRDNNQWYSPRHVWPGGRMDDAAVARWVKTL
jgi:hypothetical protein